MDTENNNAKNVVKSLPNRNTNSRKGVRYGKKSETNRMHNQAFSSSSTRKQHRHGGNRGEWVDKTMDSGPDIKSRDSSWAKVCPQQMVDADMPIIHPRQKGPSFADEKRNKISRRKPNAKRKMFFDNSNYTGISEIGKGGYAKPSWYSPKRGK